MVTIIALYLRVPKFECHSYYLPIWWKDKDGGWPSGQHACPLLQ